MHDEIYSDGVSEITITGSIVRIDLMSLSPSERDANNNPKPVFRQRVLMPIDAFANSVELMQRVVRGLIEAGAIKPNANNVNQGSQAQNGSEQITTSRSRNSSPNFST